VVVVVIGIVVVVVVVGGGVTVLRLPWSFLLGGDGNGC